jgi:hypothetical protein
MLLWDKPMTVDNLTVYRDENSRWMFYVLANQPRFRIDSETGKPVFQFLKYRNPVDRPGGVKGGGFVIFDVEFTLSDEQTQKVQTALNDLVAQEWKQFGNTGAPPPAVLGQLSYTRGTTKVQVLDSGGALVQKIQNPGAPSLYGKMITPITVELSPEGATLMEQALQDQGGVVQVIYDIFTPVKLPPVTATIWMDASKTMQFHQQVDIDWSFWGDDDYRESIHEKWTQSEGSGVIIDPGTVTDQKVIGAVREWAQTSLDDAVKRMVLGDIAAVSADDRKVPDGIEHVTRDQLVEKIASFRRTYREGQVMEWNPSPRGTLPNITSMVDKDGKPFKWTDFARTVDLDDPFFRMLSVNTRANADFTNLPLDSIEVKIDYKASDRGPEEYSLRSSNDLNKFERFVENKDYKYTYSYQVNYTGENQRFQSPEIVTDERFLTINVGDTGILAVDVLPGDINFKEVERAEVTVRYEDNGIDPIERVFHMDKENQEFKLREVIFQQQRNPYTYSVKYLMDNGKEIQGPEKPARAPQLYINDPFVDQLTLNFLAFGDFDKDIDSILLEVHYLDEANDYSQTHTVFLNKGNTFADWTFPVISEKGGKVTYSGTITQKSGGEPTEIAETIATKNTIVIGEAPPNPIDVQILPDLLDFSLVKLVKVSMHYEGNGIPETKDIIFHKGDKTATWTYHPVKDKNEYQWQATFFMVTGPTKQSAPVTTSEMTIIPEVPA